MSNYDDVQLFAEQGIEDYSPYFLLANPFPYLQVPEERPQIFVDRTAVMDALSRVVGRVVDTGASGTMVIVGDYGAGKSHILRYTKWRINTALPRAIAAYLSPERSMLDFYGAFMEQVGLEFFQSALKGLPAGSLGGPTQMDLFGEPWVPRALPDEVLRGTTRDLQSALQNLLHPRTALLSWDWLRGVSLIAAERREIGVRASLSKETEMRRVFNGILLLIRTLGIGVVCVLLDELEKVTGLAPRDRQRPYDFLRTLLDDNPEGLCLIAAITRKGWNDLYEDAHPLRRRLLGNTAELRTFSDEDARELIRRYLQRGRERYATQSHLSPDEAMSREYPEMDPQLFPFTPEAADRINTRGRGIVSEILRIAGLLIDAGYGSGRIWAATDVDAFLDGGSAVTEAATSGA